MGPNHPDVAETLDDLAELYAGKGDCAAAKPLYQRALAIDKKALGPEHKTTKKVQKNLDQCLQKLPRS
jgi:hypothetical protein